MSAETAIDNAVGGASPRVQGLFRSALAHYGIDPSDPDYGIYRADGSQLCRVCKTHGETTKQLACDLETARAEEMERLGFEAAFCSGCRQAFPALLSEKTIRPKCPSCTRVARLPLSGYVSDGLGCVEKQAPIEREFDHRPVGPSRRAW